MLNLGIIGCGSVMQGPYMELVNKLAFKKTINLKTVCDVNSNLKKILSKKFFFDSFVQIIKKYYKIMILMSC